MNCGVTKYEARPTIIPISRLFETFFAEPHLSQPSTDAGTLAVDVAEDARDVIVRASLPGFSKEQVDAEVHDGVLTIKATQAETREETGERFYRRERRSGSFSRRIALPCAVQDTDAKADLTNGVLTLRLPKSQKDAPRKVSIN